MAANEGIGGDVAKFYNKLEEKGKESRQESRIYHMRNFNNWLKSMIINDFSDKVKKSKPRPERREDAPYHKDLSDPEKSFTVLDIGCGKGGDLLKWSRAKIDHFVGVDIAGTSVEQAEVRYEENKRRNPRMFSADFHTADCTKVDLETLFGDKKMTFDIVTSQFAFHYCFESIEQADCMLKNITNRLRPGGYFVGTTTDANDIVARVRASKASNSVYDVKFDPPLSDEEPPPIFGAKYNFHLEGVVDCPEFLVHFPTLVELADKHGLMLICQRRFDSYFNSWKDTENGRQLMKHMKVMEDFNKQSNRLAGGDPLGPQYEHARNFLESHPDLRSVGTLTKDEWEAITLYLVFAFKKMK